MYCYYTRQSNYVGDKVGNPAGPAPAASAPCEVATLHVLHYACTSRAKIMHPTDPRQWATCSFVQRTGATVVKVEGRNGAV